jgi:hypothetical protein
MPPEGAAIGVTPRPAVPVAEWPAREPWPSDAVEVEQAARSLDGQTIRVRARLVHVTVPCPRCNVVGQQPQMHDAPAATVGTTLRSSGLSNASMPGCERCPPAFVVFESLLETGLTLRAVGAASALQTRHLRGLFLLTGTWRTAVEGVEGPVLDVRDVVAIDEPYNVLSTP